MKTTKELLRALYKDIEFVQESKDHSFNKKAVNDTLNELESRFSELEERNKELEHDFDNISKENDTLKYLRDLCDRQQKVLDVLRRCPFVLERLAESTDTNKDFVKNYDYGTITDTELALIKRWLT